ncbi:unnamed protein product [Nippostrongylus brasiliensis]|uniref:SCP domain-containing protein n=1 Tax=Nippostrongylus brasiliensis TaxID=27835 RepID=A0A0N4YVT4_NIPBR|nr:unnamed protein product [Nippostrongylus brasiliensis]
MLFVAERRQVLPLSRSSSASFHWSRPIQQKINIAYKELQQHSRYDIHGCTTRYPKEMTVLLQNTWAGPSLRWRHE